MPVEERAIYKVIFMNELYPDAVDDLPLNAPNMKGRAIQISCLLTLIMVDTK